MHTLQIELLGRYAIHIDDQPITRFPTDRERGLLAYLALHANQPQRRDVLAALLWSEHDNETARRGLRQSLSRLRSTCNTALPGSSDHLLTITPHSVQLNLTDKRSSVDVAAFQELVAACHLHAHPQIAACLVCAERLARAAALCQGEFLASIHISGAPDFDAWVATLREQLHEQLVWVLHQLVEGAIHYRQLERARDEVRWLLALAPWREEAHRQCMCVLAWMGDRNAALAQYEQCRRALHDELGLDPDPATVALHAQIVKDQLPPLDVAPSHNPYQSLNAFSASNADRFFGRERYVQMALAAVQQQPFVLIVGPSGSGKSSLLHAGLVARMVPSQRQTPADASLGMNGWFVRHFRPGATPFRNLVAAFAPHEQQLDQMAESLFNEQQSLHAFSAPRIPARTRNLLLVIDQFEELFTLNADPALRQRFLRLLFSALGEQATPFTVSCVATLRADFVGQALMHPQLADVLQHSSIFLGPMAHDEFARAIVEPARLEGIELEAGLLERIVAAVEHEPGALPLLQFMLTLLWDQQVNRRLTHAAYDTLGGVTGALTRYCEALFTALTPAQQQQAQYLFLHLVHSDDATAHTRRLVSRSELDPASWQLASQLADARLLVMSHDANRGETVEIAHEALIHSWPRLREWLESDREFRAWHTRVRVSLHEWESSGHDRDALLRRVALAIAERWRAQRGERLSAPLHAYIAASLEQQQQQHGAVLAQRQREQSHLLALRAQIALSEHDTNLALSLAVAATTMYPSPEAQLLLTRAGYAPGTRQRLRGHTAPVMQVVLVPGAPDAGPAPALSASADHTVILWDLVTGLIIRRFAEHQAVVYGVAVDAIGTRAVSCAENDELIVWELATGAVQQRLHGHAAPIYCVALDASGTIAMSGGADGTVLVWNVACGTLRQRIAAHDRAVRCLALSPDGRTAISGGDDYRVRFWDVATGTALTRLPANGPQSADALVAEGHTAPVMSVAFSRDGQRAYSASPDRDIITWNLATGEHTLTASATVGVISMAALSDDQSVLVGSYDSRLLWFDLARGALHKQLLGHRSRIQTITISPDDRQALTGAADHDLRLWDLRNGAEIRRFTQTHCPFHALQVTISPDGQHLLAGGADGSLLLWNLADGTVIRHWPGHDDMIWAGVHFLPDARYAISASGGLSGTTRDATLRLWDVVSGQEVRRFVGHSDHIWDMAITADGQYALSGSHDGTLRRWEIASGACRVLLDMAPQSILSLAIHPDGRTLLAGPGRGNAANPDYALREIDLATGQEQRRLHGHNEAIIVLAISPTGRYAASCAHDATILLWDLVAGCVLHQLVGHTGSVFELLFTHDEQFLLTGSQDTTVLLWDVASGKAIRCYEGHTGIVMDLALLPDGKSFVSASEDGIVRQWRIDASLDSLLAWTRAHRAVEPLPDARVAEELNRVEPRMLDA